MGVATFLKYFCGPKHQVMYIVNVKFEHMEHLEELSDREEDFIDRAVNPRINSRLGCQCVLQSGTGTIEITLPDQTQFLGE